MLVVSLFIEVFVDFLKGYLMKKILLLLLALLHVQSYALSQCNDIHIWQKVLSRDGQWNITLKTISQEGIFRDQSCNPLDTTILSSENPLVYGFGFSKNADFDIAYTLTAVKQTPSFESRACVFVITAKGPALPEVTALSYNGAVCEWTRAPRSGELFVVG